MAGATSVILVLAVCAVLWYFPSSQRKALESGLRAKVTTVAKMLSWSLVTAVDAAGITMDVKPIEEIITSAKQDKDLIGVRVEDSSGNRLAGFNDTDTMKLDPPKAGQPPVSDFGKHVLTVVDTISKDDTPVGYLRMSYTLKVYNAKQRKVWEAGLWIGLIILFMGSLLAALVGYVIARPLGIMTSTFRRMAEGDLTQDPLEVESNDEVGLLSGAFNELLNQMRELSSKFNDFSSNMGERASEILTTAKEQEAGSAQQAATVSEVTATMEELAATAQQIAKNAESVTKSAEAAASAVEEGRDSLSSFVRSMSSIKAGNKTINDNIVQLNRHVQQIRGIIDLINDIADRSDLLALNAALEGTKAGEAGKGFLLVAAEMRRLAENVFSSTAEIKQLIAEVTEATNATVMATESGMKTTSEGVELAGEAERAFGRIIETIEETTMAAKQISLATQQQHTGTEQIVAAMGEVSEVAQTWVKGIGDTTQSVGELSSITSQLKTLVAKYRTSKEV
jgi:methyl-accepting chemotaxis protein